MFRRPAASVVDKNRLSHIAIFFLLLAGWILVRLATLQIFQHNYYATFALNAHEFAEKIHPERGKILFQDTRSGTEYPAAVNREYALLYAVPKEIPPAEVLTDATFLSNLFNYSVEQKGALISKLSQPKSVYAVIEKKVDDDIVDAIKAQKMKGIYFGSQEYRFYPEQNIGAPVVGFSAIDDNGSLVGKYGAESFWQKELAGTGGFQMGERGALGSWITLANRTFAPSTNGSDILLTIDRAVEFKACERLRQGMEEYAAKSGALILMNAQTGAIVAMCSLPDFDPNNYSKVADIRAFNNTAVFGPYEPGSVFKSITMAAGLDLGLVTPETTYTDPCSIKLNGHEIHNAEGRCWGMQTMTQVLEKSLNTGAAWVEQKIGPDKFEQYVKKFGFGKKTGIELAAESVGDISSLARKGDIFGANGSFGQGLTATPIQLVAAYAAIANGGTLLKPFIVQEVRHPDGTKETTKPTVVAQVFSAHAAKLLDGMLTSVIERHYHKAQIDHYYVAGKTGTAQIADHGKYSDTRTNHTFIGFAPATNPQYVMLVKYEEPNQPWAELTAMPVFKDVMQFTLQYYGVPGDRP